MQTVIRKRYSVEFRARAVELVRLGKPVSVVAEDLGIGTSVLYRWLGRGPHSQVVGLEGSSGSSEEAPEVELRRLRRELANLQLENDILKKAAVILGTKPQPPLAR
jgi:transposase